MKKVIITLSVMVVALAVVLPMAALCQEVSLPPQPNPQKIVGTPACPKLNAHNKQACNFGRPGGHQFQVWPGRIAVEQTNEPGIWLVTSTGHKDGMFDHVLRWRKDDHVTFQCFVQKARSPSRPGAYYGPTGFSITRGGVWATYGEPAVDATAITGTIVAFFNPPAGGAIIAGGAAAATLGPILSKYGSRSWEAQAGKVAQDICNALTK